MQGNPILSEAEAEQRVDAAILEALLDCEAQRPWSVDEIALVLNDPIDASDGLGRLVRAGLVHRHDGFVWASRSAIAADALGE
jgi:hypothetical protein